MDNTQFKSDDILCSENIDNTLNLNAPDANYMNDIDCSDNIQNLQEQVLQEPILQESILQEPNPTVNANVNVIQQENIYFQVPDSNLLSSPLIEYTAFNNIKYQLCPCVGRNIALLVPPSLYDISILTAIVLKIDSAYDFYFMANGQKPTLYYKYLTYSTVAVTDSSCGAGCGFLGATGIEMVTGFFNVLYNDVMNNNLYDQVVFYEMGRNFWFYRNKIEYVGPDEIANITTGYAVFMRFASMEYSGVSGANFGSVPFDTFKQRVIDHFSIYLSNNSLSWFNTLKLGKSATGGSPTTLVASLFFKLNSLFGEPFSQTTENSFISKLWRAVGNTTKRLTTLNAIDNLISAVSVASGTDAKPLFASWKFPSSDVPIVQLIPNTIPALQQWTSNDKVFIFTQNSNIYISSEELRDIADVFVDDILGITTIIKKKLNVLVYNQPDIKDGDIILNLDSSYVVQNEGYNLDIQTRMTVTSNNKAGIFWATRTILQLLKQNLNVLGGTAIDYPLYPERSFMVDIGRKYFTPQWLMNKVKELSYFKYNYFHWHLCDTKGFRIQSNILSTPYLVLTKAEVAMIVTLAQKYFITIVPEYEMPGHMGTWLPAQYRLVDDNGRLSQNSLNIADDTSIQFVQQIINEFLPLFPGKYIHIGADEFGADWTKLTKFLPYIQQKLNNPNAIVQDTFFYFVNTMNQFIKSKGKITRMWASNVRGNNNITYDTDIIMEVWDMGADPNLAISLGYNVMNCSFYPTYFVQGWEPLRPHYADFAIYEQWDPTLYYTEVRGDTPATNKPFYKVPLPQQNLLGGKFHIWSDNPVIETEEMVNTNTYNNLRSCSQAVWGSPKLVALFNDFLPIITTIGQQPNIIPNPLTPYNVSGDLPNPNTVIPPNQYANLVGNTKFGWATKSTLINVALNGFTLILDSGGSNTYNYMGSISGSGNLTLTSVYARSFTISGTTASTFSGTTTLTKGIVILSKLPGVISIPGDLIVNNTGEEMIIWKSSNQFSTSSNITMNSTKGTLNLDIYQETISTLKMTDGSKIIINAGGILTVNNFYYNNVGYSAGTYTNSASTTFITGAGQLVVLTNSAPLPPPILTAYNLGGNLDNPNSVIDYTKQYANLVAASSFGWKTGTCSINVALNNFQFTINNGNGNRINYSGIISGIQSGTLIISGTNTNVNDPLLDPTPITFSGRNSNTYVGITTLVKGVLELSRTNAISISGDLVVNNFSKEVIKWLQPNQFALSSNLTMNCTNGILNIGSYRDNLNTVKMINGSTINFSIGGILTVNKFYYNNVGFSVGTYTNSTATFITGTGGKLIVLANSSPTHPPPFTSLVAQNVAGNISNPNSIIDYTTKYANLMANTSFGWQTSRTLINVYLNNFEFTMNNGNGNAYNYSGIIAGLGSVVITGTNTNVNNPALNPVPIVISGTNSNVYAGTTTLNKGVLQLSRTNAISIPGDLIINNYSKEVVIWGSSNQFSVNSNILMNCTNGILNISNYQDKINNLTMISGSTINTNTPGVLTVNKLTYGNVVYSSGTYTSVNSNFIVGGGKVVIL